MSLISDVAMIVRKGIFTPLYIDPSNSEKKLQEFISGNYCSHNFKFCRGHAEVYILVCVFKSSFAVLKLRLLN